MLCSYIMQLFFKFFITNLYVCIYLCHMVDTFTMILYLLFIQVNVLWETCLWKADFMHHNNLSHVVDKFTSFLTNEIVKQQIWESQWLTNHTLHG